ncbi:MAG: hypothetical protein AAF408_14280, partial [Pseudomonadota bacterium]
SIGQPFVFAGTVLAIATIAGGGAMSEAANTTTEQTTSYLDVAERLRRNPPKSPSEVAEKIGVTLKKSDQVFEGTGTGGDGVDFAKLVFRFLPSGEPNVFVITLPDGTGPSPDTVRASFDDLRLIAAPRGRSEEEEMLIGRNEYWGTLSFGFPVKAPNNLRTIVFNYVRKK